MRPSSVDRRKSLKQRERDECIIHSSLLFSFFLWIKRHITSWIWEVELLSSNGEEDAKPSHTLGQWVMREKRLHRPPRLIEV